VEEDLVVIPKGGGYCLGVLGAGAEAESDTGVGVRTRVRNPAALLVSSVDCTVVT
jgi:hypothetical protein